MIGVGYGRQKPPSGRRDGRIRLIVSTFHLTVIVMCLKIMRTLLNDYSLLRGIFSRLLLASLRRSKKMLQRGYAQETGKAAIRCYRFGWIFLPKLLKFTRHIRGRKNDHLLADSKCSPGNMQPDSRCCPRNGSVALATGRFNSLCLYSNYAGGCVRICPVGLQSGAKNVPENNRSNRMGNFSSSPDHFFQMGSIVGKYWVGGLRHFFTFVKSDALRVQKRSLMSLYRKQTITFTFRGAICFLSKRSPMRPAQIF